MSEHAAPPPAAPAGPKAPEDPLQDLAEELYKLLCANIYSAVDAKKPDPKAVAQLSFKLAETFLQSSLDLNPIVRAAREAKEKASVNMREVEIDFAKFEKKG